MKGTFEQFAGFILYAMLLPIGIFGFWYALSFLFQALAIFQTKTDCIVEFIDGSKIKATSCDMWRDSTVLECGNRKSYSVYAVKSWECK